MLYYMKFIPLLLLSLLAFLLWNTHYAEAETSPQKKLFLEYLVENKAYNRTLKAKSQQIFAVTFPDCKTIDTVKRMTPRIIMPPRYDGLTLEEINKPYTFETVNPSGGQWIDRSLIEGCGRKTQVNYIVTAYSLDALPVMYPAINGQTRISLIEQDKAEAAIHEKLRSAKNCRERPMVLGSLFLGYRTADNRGTSEENKNRGWFERWVARACDMTHVINLAILPDSTEGYKYVTQIVEQSPTEGNFTETDADE